MDKSVRIRPQRPERAKEMAPDEAKPQCHTQIRRSEPPNRRIAITSLLDAHSPVTCADLPKLSCTLKKYNWHPRQLIFFAATESGRQTLTRLT